MGNKNHLLFILGIDGMDPRVFESLSKRGEMPNLTGLSDDGGFRYLATTIPPQSPVVWSTISTGKSPGEHGIFDFLRKSHDGYLPELALFGIEKYIGGVRYTSSIKTETVFHKIARQQIPVTLLRWPLTFPVSEDVPNNMRILPGLGVPDIRGTLGQYLFYTTDKSISSQNKRGRVIHLNSSSSKINTDLYGPPHMTWRGVKDSSIPLTIEKINNRVIRVQLADTSLELNLGKWSNILNLNFPIGVRKKVSCITRVICVSIEPHLSIFFLPLQIDPNNTNLPYCSPTNFGADLWQNCGPFLTVGMPEDTNGLNDGLISAEHFLSLCDDVFAERERMMWATLQEFKEGVFACVFDTLDRIQHMFWRSDDEIIESWYRKIDAMVGRILDYLGEDSPLIILSDHGFGEFRYSVHINTWLICEGFMKLKKEAKEGRTLFEDVDWSKTTAFALGLNSVYINKKGRDKQGIVDEKEVKEIIKELIKKFENWSEGGHKPILKAYSVYEIFNKGGVNDNNVPDIIVGYADGYRTSWVSALGGAPGGSPIELNNGHWCGDHCCDQSIVPGVLFTKGIKLPDLPSVMSIADMILDWAVL